MSSSLTLATNLIMNGEYRKNVGIVVLKDNLIFAGFRKDVEENSKTGWQMPQGGIEEGEDLMTAGFRELFEETCIKKNKIKFIAQMPNNIKYDFDNNYIEKHKNTRFAQYKGQEQYWLVFEFLGANEDINLHATAEEPEFSKWEWKTANFLLNNIIEFKKEVYKKLFNWMISEKLIQEEFNS